MTIRKVRKVAAGMVLAVTLGACGTPLPLVRLGGGISVKCTEDMACWDCHTMGNKVCGTLPRST